MASPFEGSIVAQRLRELADRIAPPIDSFLGTTIGPQKAKFSSVPTQQGMARMKAELDAAAAPKVDAFWRGLEKVMNTTIGPSYNGQRGQAASRAMAEAKQRMYGWTDQVPGWLKTQAQAMEQTPTFPAPYGMGMGEAQSGMPVEVARSTPVALPPAPMSYFAPDAGAGPWSPSYADNGKAVETPLPPAESTLAIPTTQAAIPAQPVATQPAPSVIAPPTSKTAAQLTAQTDVDNILNKYLGKGRDTNVLGALNELKGLGLSSADAVKAIAGWQAPLVNTVMGQQRLGNYIPGFTGAPQKPARPRPMI